MKKILILILGICLFSCVSAGQVLWDNDTQIEVYDTWEDINGLPLTGATCTWYVYNPSGTINDSGIPTDFAEGIINFTVNQLIVVDTYPMFINCTKGIYNGTSSLREIKIVDELSEEYKDRLIEINQTTFDIYDLLNNSINVTLTSLINTTNLTFGRIVQMEIDITNLDNNLSSLTTYLEAKWGNEDADEIMDKLKDIRGDVTYLRSRYYSLSEEERGNLLIAIREDSREMLDLLYGKDKWWEGILIYLIPGILLTIMLIITIVVLSKKKKKNQIEDFGGPLNERR